MDIDAIIAEANASVSAQTQPENSAEEQKEVELDKVENSEGDAQEQAKEDSKSDEYFPKKAQNAISRRDKKIGRLQAERLQMMREIESLRATRQTQDKPVLNDGYPKEEDFEGKTYGDYVKAVAAYEAKQSFEQLQKESSEKQSQQQKEEWKSERLELLENNETQAQSAFSDFEKVVHTALSEIKFRSEISNSLLEADNPAFALYAMAKEGVLEDLNDLSPTKAAMMIARYEDKGLSLSKQKQISKAPAPMTPNKGIGGSSKSLNNMSADELVKWVYS